MSHDGNLVEARAWKIRGAKEGVPGNKESTQNTTRERLDTERSQDAVSKSSLNDGGGVREGGTLCEAGGA